MNGWTEERVARLCDLWGRGVSAADIARDLGGIHRNAVIGKVMSLRLGDRREPAPARSCAAPGCTVRLAPETTTMVCKDHVHGPHCLCGPCVARRAKPAPVARANVRVARVPQVGISLSGGNVMVAVSLPREPWA